MSAKFKASISKGNPPKGTLKGVVSFKDNGGGRWEYDGSIPLSAGKVIMALCSSNGERLCLNDGRDLGIEMAYLKGGA